ncbi:MAG: hypothetical protein ACFFED_00165 [Candidatus Thorarchaeota archaeon]
MSSIRDQKMFENLNFQIWLIKDEQSGKWREQVYIIGTDEALGIIKDSLQGLLDVFQTYGKGTRIYKCNPPSDFDPVSFGKENGVTIRWLDQLVVRLGFDAMDNEPFILEDFVVNININPSTLRVFIEKIQTYLDSDKQYTHGVDAVCGLRLSSDWVGAE